MLYPTIDNFEKKAERLRFLILMSKSELLSPPMEDPFGLHEPEPNQYHEELLEVLKVSDALYVLDRIVSDAFKKENN